VNLRNVVIEHDSEVDFPLLFLTLSAINEELEEKESFVPFFFSNSYFFIFLQL
jgi:hypothetical protein